MTRGGERNMKRQEGFTLIELMVVILIIGILVAIAVPVFFSARTSAEQGACRDNMRTIDSAIMTYNAATGAYPADITFLDNTDYLKDAPVCPAGTDPYIWNAPAGEAPYVTCPNGHTLT